VSVTVKIFYPHLKQYTDNQEIVKVNGSTVGEYYVYFFINGKSAYPTDLAKPVRDGDELTIALLLAGG